MIQSSNTGGYDPDSAKCRRFIYTNSAPNNLLVRMKFDATECYPSLFLRHGTADVEGRNCYALDLQPQNGTWQLSKQVEYATTLLGSVKTQTFTAGTWYWVRFTAIGTAITGRIWEDGTAEPAAQSSVTDSTYAAAGYTGIRLGVGNAAESARCFIDDLTIRAS